MKNIITHILKTPALAIEAEKGENGENISWTLSISYRTIKRKPSDADHEYLMQWGQDIVYRQQELNCSQAKTINKVRSTHDGILFVVEPCDMTLYNWMKLNNNFVFKIELLYQIALLLKRLKSQRIVHRDLRPELIGITHINKGKKIVEFILMKNAKKLPQHQKTIPFTPIEISKYSAPEIRAQNHHDFLVDVWSFGIICYEVIFEREFPELGQGQMAIIYPTIVPSWFKEIVDKMLAVKVTDRYTIEDVLHRLKNLKLCSEVASKSFCIPRKNG